MKSNLRQPIGIAISLIGCITDKKGGISVFVDSSLLIENPIKRLNCVFQSLIIIFTRNAFV